MIAMCSQLTIRRVNGLRLTSETSRALSMRQRMLMCIRTAAVRCAVGGTAGIVRAVNGQRSAITGAAVGIGCAIVISACAVVHIRDVDRNNFDEILQQVIVTLQHNMTRKKNSTCEPGCQSASKEATNSKLLVSATLAMIST